MTELAKVLEDMRTAPSFRKKLYFLSPILTAAAFDVYALLGLRRLRAILGQTHAPRTEAQGEDERRQLKALGLTELKVFDGPFAGMTYGDFATGSPLIPKIMGTYEAELHPWVSTALTSGYDCVINAGSAEGYYAVGFAYATPGIDVFAFDTDPVTDEMVPRLAALNGLQSRVHKRGHCGPGDLEAIVTQHKRTLLFVDIEGFEDELLDIDQAPSLSRADIIVETHDGFNSGVTRRLIERLWPSHHFEIVAAVDDDEREIPALIRERIADPALARALVAEARGMPQLWLRFRARKT